MLKTILASVSLMLAGTQVVAAQEVAAAQCEGCSFEQMKGAARSEIDFGGVAVFSLSTSDLRTFVINGATMQLFETTPPAALVDYYANLIHVYESNGNSLTVNVNTAQLTATPAARVNASAASSATGDFPQSAYDALNNSAQMNNLLDAMHNRWPSLIAGGNSVVRVLNPTTYLKADGAQVRVRLHFRDGSTMEIIYNNKANAWEAVRESARDSHNNSIPTTREDFARGGYREYNFNGPPATDLQGFLLQAQRLGIPVTGPIGTRYSIACSSAGNGIATCQSF